MVINGEKMEWQPWAVVVRGATTLWMEIEVMARGFPWSLGCGHGVTAGYSVAWLMVVSGEGGITGNP